MAPVAVIVYKRRVVGDQYPKTSNSLMTKHMRYDWVLRGIVLNHPDVPLADLLYMHKVK